MRFLKYYLRNTWGLPTFCILFISVLIFRYGWIEENKWITVAALILNAGVMIGRYYEFKKLKL